LKIKYEQKNRQVVGNELEWFTVVADSQGTTHSDGIAYAENEGEGGNEGSVQSGATQDGVSGEQKGWAVNQGTNWNRGISMTNSEQNGQTHTTTVSETPMLLPVWREIVTSREFLSLDEQIAEAEKSISALPERHAFARLHDQKSPFRFRTPDVDMPKAGQKRVDLFREEKLSKWPFALPCAEADRRLEEQKQVLDSLIAPAAAEPVGSRRRRTRRDTMETHGADETPPADGTDHRL
jgi:hypothetical protein